MKRLKKFLVKKAIIKCTFVSRSLLKQQLSLVYFTFLWYFCLRRVSKRKTWNNNKIKKRKGKKKLKRIWNVRKNEWTEKKNRREETAVMEFFVWCVTFVLFCLISTLVLMFVQILPIICTISTQYMNFCFFLAHTNTNSF